jgi:uncharacterized protein (TIGR00270 family)
MLFKIFWRGRNKLSNRATCEICGEVGKVSPAIFEGGRVLACGRCTKAYKLTMIKPKREWVAPQPRPLMKKHRPKAVLKGDYVMVEDYGRIVRSAREARGLTLEDLAKVLNEKVSILKKVETEKIIPPPALISKLEHVLRVKMVEEVGEKPVSLGIGGPQDRKPTLGDVAVFKEGGEDQQGPG